MIKYLNICFFLVMVAWSMPAKAQGSSQLAFNQAANYFIDGQNKQALQTVNSALQKYPNDLKLQTLKKKLEEQQEQQNQKDQQQEGESEDKKESEEKEGESKEEKEDKEGKSEEEKEGENKEEKESEEGKKEDKEGESKEGENEDKEGDPGMEETEKRLQEMNISPEKARMILEAMRSNEVQYLQQKKRKQSKRSNSGKPDW